MESYQNSIDFDMKVIQRLFIRNTMIEYYVYLSNKIGEYRIFVEVYAIFLTRFACGHKL